MEENWEYVAEGRIREFGSAALRSLGVPGQDAELVIDSLIQAELWGHSSHGLLRFSWYFERLKSGAMVPEASPELVVDSGAICVIDAHEGIGQVITNFAASEVSKRARQYGVAAVGVRNSNHFGTAMYYTRALAKQGLVAILTTNASPSMAPWGGSKKVLGNNPWSIAAPYRDGVVALDMANTVVARGKIYAALEKQDSIPDDWAITSKGKRTTNAQEAVDGVILPMGGHKGYAITFMMDVLSGVLTGSQVATGVNGPYNPTARSGAGHLLIAIDAENFANKNDYDSKIQQLISEVKGAPLAEGFTEIFYPGEVEDRAEAENRKLPGIKMFQSTIDEFQKIANTLEIKF
jgi:LDH2 family malate/lactate/ureidoglycolate dehydrogenase